MELTPKQELFAQAVVKHNGHQTKAYLEVYPKAKYDSARHSASILLTNAYIKQRVYEILEQNGLGLKEVAKKLSECINDEGLYSQGLGLTLTVRLYCSLFKSWGGIGLTPDEMAQIQQMIKDFEEKQDSSGAI